MALNQILKEADLEITDKTKVEPSFQRFIP